MTENQANRRRARHKAVFSIILKQAAIQSAITRVALVFGHGKKRALTTMPHATDCNLLMVYRIVGLEKEIPATAPLTMASSHA